MPDADRAPRNLQPSWVPDGLPVLRQGAHATAGHSMDLSEALRWLEAAEGCDRPPSVHPVVWQVVQRANGPTTAPTEQLWSLLLASAGTAGVRCRPSAWAYGLRARWRVRRAPGDWLDIWQRLVEDLPSPRQRSVGRKGARKGRPWRIGRLVACTRRRTRPTVWVDTFHY